MCIIIVKPKNKVIDERLAKHCWEKNKDGAGFAFGDGKKLRIYRVLDSFDKFWNMYKRYVTNPQREKKISLIMHFRIATSGAISKENIHPFRLNEKLAFAHNGMISSITIDKSNNRSDTNEFNRILQELPDGWTKNESIMKLIRGFIGFNSKLAFINYKGGYSIVREHLGTWDEDTGLWFSNSGYKDWDVEESIIPFVPSDEFRWNRNKNRYPYSQTERIYPPLEPSRPLSLFRPTIPNASDEEHAFATMNKKNFLKNKEKAITCNSCGIILFTENEAKKGNCNYCTNLAASRLSNLH